MRFLRTEFPLATAVAALVLSATAASAQELTFPMKAEDLGSGMRLSTGPHDGGIQDLGLDIGSMRHLGGGRWTDLKAGAPSDGSDLRNEDVLVYGLPFYAMADGEVIGCWRNAPENRGPGQKHPARLAPGGSRIIGGGNHLWVRHDDGRVALYAHAIPGTIPSSLCPHDAALTSSPAGPFAGHPDVDPQAFVPSGVAPTTPTGPGVERPRVKRGQRLGLVGNSGSSGGPHLHVHVESGFSGTSQPVAMRFERGLWTPRTHLGAGIFEADINDWRSFSGRVLPDRPVIVWPPRTVTAEYARHGFEGRAFQRQFDHLANSGYMPEVLDCYGVGGRLFFNMIWRPADGRWSAVAGVTPRRFQQAFDEADGFTPVFVDSCSAGSETRYVAIFREGQGGAVARHGLSESQHEALLDQMIDADFAPVSVSVVSRNGTRRYTVLYRPVNLGSWTLRSRLRRAGGVDQYDDLVDAAADGNRKPVYVNAYMHNGEQHFVAIIAERPPGAWQARHNRTGSAY